LVVERQGAGGNKTVQIVNLGQHGLCQADLERPEYIIAGALWVQDKGSPLRQPRFDGHLRKRTNNLEEVFDDKASESSSVYFNPSYCWVAVVLAR